MKSSESQKLNDSVQVDEFTIRRKRGRKSEFNIDRYLAEYSFRINRSQNKDTIFNKLMKRMLEREPIFQPQLACP